MKTLGNTLRLALCVSVLAVLTIPTSSSAVDPGPPGGLNVTVTNTPLPVSGSIGVSGTVAATQSGTWNVGVTGTPNVSVGNVVAVQNVDEKGRVPYMQSGFQSCAPGNGLCDLVFPAVPAGKRLVIEHVSANIGLNGSSSLNGTFLLAGGAVFSLPGRSMATPELVGVNETVLAYLEAGQAPVYRLAFSSSTGSGEDTCVISGYVVDLSQ